MNGVSFITDIYNNKVAGQNDLKLIYKRKNNLEDF